MQGPIILREVVDADCLSIRDAMADGQIAKYVSRIPYPYPKGAEIEFLEHLRNSDEVAFAIVNKAKLDELMGLISWVPNKLPVDAELEIGYWLHPKFWGNGIISDALAQLIKKISKMGVQSVCAGVMQGNIASTRVLEKNGFYSVGAINCYSVSRGEEVPAIAYVLQINNRGN